MANVLNWKVEREDANAFLRRVSNSSVDLIVTDPPYNHLEAHRAIGTTTRLKGRWFDTLTAEQITEVLRACYRVLRAGRHLYLVCNTAAIFDMQRAVESAGFTTVQMLVWDKSSIGMGYHFRSRYEFVIMAAKLDTMLDYKRTNHPQIFDDLIRAKVPRGKGVYPTQKPVALMDVLIEQSSDPKELVVDPFCGSGTVGLSAVQLGRRFLGCDVETAAIREASGRLLRATTDVRGAATCEAPTTAGI